MSHTIAVMYLGRIVEFGDAGRVSLAPSHPYAQALFSAALPPDPRSGLSHEIVLAGEVASPLHPPEGCHFHPRCRQALPICGAQSPPLAFSSARMVACHLCPETAAPSADQAD